MYRSRRLTNQWNGHLTLSFVRLSRASAQPQMPLISDVRRHLQILFQTQCEHPFAPATGFGSHSFGCSSVAKLILVLLVAGESRLANDDRVGFRTCELMFPCRLGADYSSWACSFSNFLDSLCILTESRKPRDHIDGVAPRPPGLPIFLGCPVT